MNAIGIDLGTSGIKSIVLGERGDLLAEATAPLQGSRPHPLWSAQDPADWLAATDRAAHELRQRAGPEWKEVRALAVAGQTHGARSVSMTLRHLATLIYLRTFRCARALIAGIETMHMIRKNQLDGLKDRAPPAAQQFYSLDF